jgi:hypothetical protein
LLNLGIAAIKKNFAKRLHEITNERVRVCLPGKFNQPAHKGQFAPRSKGNFKHKALVEGSFNLVDNFFSALPGQVGLNRLTCPEELHGREIYFKHLLKVAESIPVEEAAKLKLPFLTWKEFLSRAYELYQAMISNPDHNLEGWDDLGYHATEYRLPSSSSSALSTLNPQPSTAFSDWQRMPSLGSDSYNQIMTQLEACEAGSLGPVGQSSLLTRARNLSRAEVFHMEHQKALASGEIVRLSPWRYCDLVGIENGHPVTVTDRNLFVIDSEKITLRRAPLRYLAAINGRHLQSGDQYLAFVNPFSPRVMLLCRHDGTAVGLCEQWESPCANDEEAILRQVGKQGHWEAQRRAAINERHAGEAAQLEHMREHNAAVIAAASQRQLHENSEAETAAKTFRATKSGTSSAVIEDQLSRSVGTTSTASLEDQWD